MKLAEAQQGAPKAAASAAPMSAEEAGSLRVLLCGPIAPFGQPAGGGYEAANRRTIDALRTRGVQVLELPYPRARDSQWRKALRYAGMYLHHACRILLLRRGYDVLHLTPLNMQFAWAETLLLASARLARRPVVFDIRAGTFVRHYHGAGRLYRMAIDASLRLAARVAVEGRAYIPFVRQRHGLAPYYFPNFVSTRETRAAVWRDTPARHAPICIVYAGRIVSEKGLDTALAAVGALKDRGLQVRIDLLGDGPQDYIDQLQRQHAGLPMHWHGALPPDRLLPILAAAHFFLFPSRHDGEGHSNALNEAMALGVVPISSRQGFSADVVGDSGALLRVDAPAEDYAAAMARIVLEGRWSILSARAAARVRKHFSEDAALPGLIELYRSLLVPR